jgi:hypothetical protein
MTHLDNGNEPEVLAVAVRPSAEEHKREGEETADPF